MTAASSAFYRKKLYFAPFAIGLNATMLLCGFLVARIVCLSSRQSVALAMVIAGSAIKQGAMVIPSAIYGVLMYAGGVIFLPECVDSRVLNQTKGDQFHTL